MNVGNSFLLFSISFFESFLNPCALCIIRDEVKEKRKGRNMNVVILTTDFTQMWKNRGKEEFIRFDGQDIETCILSACREAGLSVVKKWEDTEKLLVIASSVIGISAKDLKQMITGEQKVFFDRYGKAFAMRTIGSAVTNDMLEKEDAKDDSFFAVTRITDLSMLIRQEKACFEKRCSSFIEKGVRIDYPDRVRIGSSVTIGMGTHIRGSGEISGESVIGEDCILEGEFHIADSIIGAHVTIRSSVIESSHMEEGSDIGPFAHLRPGAHIGQNVHIGNFVEVKKAVLGEGTKAGHLAYIGDADVGKGVNISCGVIFCNYDGKKKHRSHIGDHSFIGSNANLVAPVSIGDDAYIAAGSTITKDVSKGALVIERSKQREISGYVQKKRERGEL